MVQFEHTAVPLTLAYVPPLQGTHVELLVAPTMGDADPGGHREHTLETGHPPGLT